MEQKTEHSRPECPSRRDALRRLSGAVVAAYVVPEVLILSEAKAGNSTPSTPVPSPPAPSAPAPSTPSPSPSSTNTDDVEDSNGTDPNAAAERARDTCNIPNPKTANTISISRSDMQRSQEAIDAGYAKPLNQIWGNFISGYDGKVIGVEFLGRQNNPRYRFRAISKSGRLETVTISAQTGAIQQIVGCG